VNVPPVGTVIHGFAFGAFGRDSYDCRRVEAIGADWIVTRNRRGEVELCWGDRLDGVNAYADVREGCSDTCDEPVMWE
jgi:hypothetical protein